MRILGAGKEIIDQYIAVNQSRRIAYGFLSKVYEKEITVDVFPRISVTAFVHIRWTQLNNVLHKVGPT